MQVRTFSSLHTVLIFIFSSKSLALHLGGIGLAGLGGLHGFHRPNRVGQEAAENFTMRRFMISPPC
jgi:hypothetical protein